MTILIIIAAFGGGAVRGMVGFIKHQFSYKNVGFNLPYFLAMLFISGIVGVLVASAFNVNAVFAFIIGYAGGDFLENVYKIIAKKKEIYFPLKDVLPPK
ncbi:MAG TPA: hypothetical protein QGH92_01650 [Candidatus Parcubacteria bacterium]|jgi:hypothetical protein|nr:hypothetical protein [Parcubacteria group bacterium]HJN62287.1 hypothetical protein [Candidatus Parcubacteria bacterium]|tara:strand:- start:124 stop:420 length:297 start_codon:yes stop_codon:yes gene_type:complete